MEQTIYGIATPMGKGGIAIVRISGDRALCVLKEIFTPTTENYGFKSHFMAYGSIKNGEDTIDMCMAVYFKGPSSYTREDVVELHLHGGNAVVKACLALLSQKGLRLSEAGEFTKRAFLNGRIDLTKAEAVMDVINADTSLYAKRAVSQLEGSIKTTIDTYIDKLLNILAQMDVCIDYPEEDIEDTTKQKVKVQLIEIIDELNHLVSKKMAGEILNSGLKIAIVGSPNVGKSSLLNAILGTDRVIVTDIPGTTRDTLCEMFEYKGVAFTFIDTAGIRESEDIVEKMGIEKSHKTINNAHIVLCVLDGTKSMDQQDMNILEITKQTQRIIVINKSDKENLISKTDFSQDETLLISAKTQQGIDALLESLYVKAMDNIGDVGLITNNRHISLVNNSIKNLQSAVLNIDNDDELECIEIDIRDAWHNLGEITGMTYDEEIVNRIFEKFCLGK